MRFTRKEIFKRLRSLYEGAQDWLVQVYTAVVVHLNFILSAAAAPFKSLYSKVRNRTVNLYYWGRRKHLLHRRTREARDRLAEQMGAGTDASSHAEDKVQLAAENAADKAPLTSSQPASPSGDDPPMDVAEELMPALETVAEDVFSPEDYNTDPVGADMRASVNQKLTGGLEATDERENTDRLSVSSREVHDANLEDAGEVVPPPHRSDVKKTDLTVRGAWETNPNSADEIQEAARFPIVDNQITKIIEHLITSKPKITGPEDQAEIIRKWFEVDMEIGSNHKRGLNRFVDEIADQIIRYGSAALIKQRTRSQILDSYTDPVTGGSRAPVWGYALPDMSSLQVFIDTKGRPRKWRQHPHYYAGSHNVKSYRARDVFMARLPVRQSSMYFWTPSMVMPVIYAIEVLRDLHDTLESHTKNIVDIPSYVQVGDKDYIDGKSTSSMLEQVANSIRSASRGMMLVIPWYVNIDKVESEDYTEELVDVAEFWERIVRRGVGGSKLDDGEPDSANRSTADTIDEMGMRAAQAIVPEIQRAFRWLVIDKLFEHGYTPEDLGSHDEMVRLEFEDIDLAQQMAREGHVAFLFQNDLLKHSEARKRLDEDPDPNREDTYYSDIQMKLEKADSNKSETESRVRPNGEPKPKRKNDGRDMLPEDHPANDA